MSLYIYFLKGCGYRGIISTTEVPEDINTIQQHQIIINIKNNDRVSKKVIKKKKKFYRRCCFRMTINAIYTIFLLISILWPCIYIIVKLFQKKDFRYIYSNIFTFLPPVQYILGLIYFQKKHFLNTLKNNKKYNIYINLAFLLGLTVCILLATISVVLIVLNVNMNLYSDLYGTSNIVGKIFVCIAVFIKKFYGHGLIFTNLTVFSTVFLIHSKNMKNFNNTLDEYIDNIDNDSFTVDSITHNFAEKKKHTSSMSTNQYRAPLKDQLKPHFHNRHSQPSPPDQCACQSANRS